GILWGQAPMAEARGLQLPRTGCRHRLLDISPLFSGDVDRGIVVRMHRHAATLAGELRWRLPIRLLTMTALAAPATDSPGVYQLQRYARPGSLIGQEGAELEEGPGMPRIALLVANRYSCANPPQVFEGECLARCGGFLYQGLADNVVGVALEP